MGLPFLLVSLLSVPAQETTPRELTGVVRDEGGRPVPDAILLVRGEGQKASLEKPRMTRTDLSGRFRIDPGSGDIFKATLFAPGFAVSSRQSLSPGAVLEIELSRGLSVEGVVLDARTKEPIPGTRLETSTLSATDIRAPYLPGFGKSESTSDGRGRFRLSGLLPGTVYVAASARGYARVDLPAASGEENLEIFLAQGGGSLAGIILSSEGEPLAGASVVALTIGNESTGPWNWGPKVEASSNGRFEIFGLAADSYRILAYHPDAAFRILPEVRVEDAEVPIDELRLPEGLRIAGELVDEDGEPLEGEIQVETFDGERPPFFLSDRTLGLTDGRGRFELEMLAPGEYSLRVQASGFPEERVTALLEENDVDLGPIVFDHGLEISGLVVDAGGEPIAGAVVIASEEPDRMEEVLGRVTPSASSETSSEGAFRLRGLDPSTFHLSVSAPGYLEDETVTVEAGAADVVLSLSRAGAISGNVVNESGNAIAEFYVVAVPSAPPSRGARRSLSAGGDGRFLVDGLAPGEYGVTVHAEGFKAGKAERISVKPGVTSDVGAMVLGRGGRILGTVSSSEGASVAGATVALAPSFIGATTTSDARGSFELAGLEEGVVGLKVSHPDYADAFVGNVEIRSEREPVEVRVELGPGGRIEGRVQDRDGAPLPGRALRLERRFRDDETATTGPDGAFRWDGLPTGFSRVVLMSADSNASVRVQERAVEVKAGETTHVVFESRPIFVSGHVTKRGASVVDAHVAFRPEGAGGGFWTVTGSQPIAGPIGLNAITGPDGFYELYVESPGAYVAELTASDGSAFPEKRIVIPDRETHALDLGFDTVSVTGRVVTEESETPVAGAWVAAYAVDPKPVEMSLGSYRTDEKGDFALELEPGRYRIRVQADGFSREETTLTVHEGSIPDVLVALGEGNGIRGVVLDVNGDDPGRYAVHAVEDEGPTTDPPRFSAWAEIRPDRTFELENLSDRRYNLLAASDVLGFAFAPGVAPGEELTLILRPGSRIALTVLDPDGAPVAGARVVVSAIGGRKVRGVLGRTGADGRVELSAPAGSLEIKAVNDGDLVGVVRVTAQEGGRTETRVVLERAPAGPVQPGRK